MKCQLLFNELRDVLKDTKEEKNGYEVFEQIRNGTGEGLEISKDILIVKIKGSKGDQSRQCKLKLDKIKISAAQSIAYLKEYSTVKDDSYKSQILKLKTKIYSLMTQVEDATSLIRSQSIQAKSCRDQVRSLKKQLQLLQQDKKKQQSTFLIEVGVQHENSTQFNDIIECLESPEEKNVYFDREKLAKLTAFIERQIRENERMLYLATESLPHNVSQGVTNGAKVMSTGNISISETKGNEPLTPTPNIKQRVKYSPQKVYLFQKAVKSIKMEGYQMKTVELN